MPDTRTSSTLAEPPATLKTPPSRIPGILASGAGAPVSSGAVSEPVIETDRLTKRFGAKLALHEMSLRLEPGGIHAVVGSNGAGKTTLFRILLGLVSPSRGSSRVLGTDSGALDPATRGRIGLVTEEHALPSWMSVASLTAMRRALHPRWNEAIYREVVGHFLLLPGQKISQLSRGERAGLSLALALAQEPDLLILDEPTLGLDVVAKQALLESLLFAGERTDCTLVYCSHQMDEVERLADDLVVLERGALISHSTPETFWKRIRCFMVEALPADGPDPSSLPGLLQRRDIDGQEHLFVIDQDENFGEKLESLGYRGCHPVPVGFDRAVNAFLTRGHVAPADATPIDRPSPSDPSTGEEPCGI
ncbi:MAG: ABC transporter ATP-binding protein [Holophagales bacterium]|nr:ABC transporter ATP-binding protein [Holophagales bacterium]